MKRTGFLSRTSPMRRKRDTPRNRKAVVRLTGRALKVLRGLCWHRDMGICLECGTHTFWEARFDGDTRAYDMAHIKSRGAGGSDTLENVVTKCHRCHMAEHAGKGLKPDFGTGG